MRPIPFRQARKPVSTPLRPRGSEHFFQPGNLIHSDPENPGGTSCPSPSQMDVSTSAVGCPIMSREPSAVASPAIPSPQSPAGLKNVMVRTASPVLRFQISSAAFEAVPHSTATTLGGLATRSSSRAQRAAWLLHSGAVRRRCVALPDTGSSTSSSATRTVPPARSGISHSSKNAPPPAAE